MSAATTLPSRRNGVRRLPGGAGTALTAVVLLLSLSLTLFSGCNRSVAENAPTATPTAAATFNAGRGLRLSPAGAAFIAVETADATASGAELRIPASALLRTIKGTFVYVANGDWYLRTPVTVSRGDSQAPLATIGAGGTITIAEGLYEGDRVVSRGTDALWLAEIHAVNGGVSCAHGH